MKWDNFTAKPALAFKSKSEKFASDLFSDAITQDELEPYTPQLRGSSLPICILLHAHDLLKPHVRENTARLQHYSIQGTAFHEWYQKKLTYSKKWGKYVFGDWECSRCEQTHFKFQTRPKEYRSFVCPGCKAVGLRYRELEGKYKGIIGIHVDMVLKFPGERFWVFEFKTTGRYQIEDPLFNFKPKHFNQASAYPIILEDALGIKPEKYFIGYVNRDSPQFSKTAKRQSRWFPFKNDTSIIKKRRAQLDQVVAGEKARIKYFNDPTLKNLQRLDDLRPCKSLKDYTAPLMGMKDKYETSESCPYVKGSACSCFKTGKLSRPARDLQKIMENKDAKRVS